MEEILPGKMEYNLEFKGEGKLWNRNRQLALTIVTLVYYPWAAKRSIYVWANNFK
jgi:uncharacterized membrane protein YjgN (DUF898 family)